MKKIREVAALLALAGASFSVGAGTQDPNLALRVGNLEQQLTRLRNQVHWDADRIRSTSHHTRAVEGAVVFLSVLLRDTVRPIDCIREVSGEISRLKKQMELFDEAVQQSGQDINQLMDDLGEDVHHRVFAKLLDSLVKPFREPDGTRILEVRDSAPNFIKMGIDHFDSYAEEVAERQASHRKWTLKKLREGLR